MKALHMSYKQDTSRESAGPFRVFTRSADVSRRLWRRLTLRGMSIQLPTLTIRYRSSFRVCSPDIAIQGTKYSAFPRYSTSRLFMNSQTIRGRKRRSRNPSYQSRVFQSRRVKLQIQIARGQRSILPRSEWLPKEYESYSLSDAQILTGQLSLPSSQSRDAAGYTITLNASSTSGST
jgi:hypothetical protein